MKKPKYQPKKISIYTDGSCVGNQKCGFGGWSFVVVDVTNDRNEIIFENSNQVAGTDNNEMELVAVIEVMKYIKSIDTFHISIFTDSGYVFFGITKFAENWKKSNWKGKNRKSIKGKVRWKELVKLNDFLSDYRSISWFWIKSHSDNEFNDKAHELAKKQAKDLMEKFENGNT